MQALLNNLSSEAFWIRLVFMLVFAFVAELAIPLLLILVIIQFVYRLFTEENQTELYNFSTSVSAFVYHIYRYLTYQTETKPFPFSDWPKGDAKASGNVDEDHR